MRDRLKLVLAVAGVTMLVGGIQVHRAIAQEAGVVSSSAYPGNVSPLKPTPFVALPLGSVKAQGWLLKQLEMQKAGLTGHAEEALTELGETSAWRGGDKDNWERSPYYVKGLIPLAYTLDDAELKERAKKWVEWSLASQREDGFYGPKQNDDWWPRMVSNYFLRDYFEATGDERVIAHLTRYFKYMLKEMPKRPLRDWGRSRAGDDMDTVVWLYNRTKEPFLIDVLDLLRSQAYDWPTIMHENLFQGFGKDFQLKHNVNIPQAMKMPAVSWQRTGDGRERSAIDAGDEHLMRENGLSLGLQSGTEFLSGRSSGQGVEFCSIVEQMLSDETIVRIYGEGRFADRLEQLAYNALPAAWNRDLTALRYYTMPNHVIAHVGTQGFGQNYHNGNVYGPRSGYPCCCFNVHMGWPKFVQNSWAATEDGGLAVVAYGPTTVTAKVSGGGGAVATIVQETSYPFGDEVTLKVSADKAATFPLVLRTPGWCEGATWEVNGAKVEAAKAGEFGRINREWKTGDVVKLKFPMQVRTKRGVHESVSVQRGPLIYTLELPATKKVLGQPAGKFDEYEETPTKAWNYALVTEGASLPATVELMKDTPAGANPFDAKSTPVKLRLKGKKLPGWGLAWNGFTAADPPESPVQSDGSEEMLTLVPFGSQDLRLTDFPVLGVPPESPKGPWNFAFDTTDTKGWSWYGGGWWANGGKLRTSYTSGVSGFKAVIERCDVADLEMEALVTPPPEGDAGVIFRVAKPSIGADAYEGYYAGVSASGGYVVLGKADGKTWQQLGRANRAVPTEGDIKVRVRAVGPKIEVFVGDDEKPILAADDATWKHGTAGVRMYTNDGERAIALFDDVKLKLVK